MIDVNHENAILRSFILFVQTASVILKYADAHLYRRARLSVIKLIVLQALDNNNGVMTPSEIADWTQTERHNITALVDRMKRNGLVTTERSTTDKRFVNISLTERGREVLTGVMPAAREIVDQVMSSVSENDAVLLEKSLKILRQNARHGLEYLAKPAPARRG